MPRGKRELFIQVNQFTDAVVIAVMFWLAHLFREQLTFLFPWQFSIIASFRYYKWLYLVILPLYPFVLDLNGYYSRPYRYQRRHTLGILLKSGVITALLVVAAMYFLGMAALARGVIMLFAVFSALGLFVKDELAQAYARAQARRRRAGTPVILVGSEDKNTEFQKELEDHPEWNLRVVYRLDPGAASLDRLPELLHQHAVGCVIFNVAQTYFSEVGKAILACEVEGVETWLVADFVKTSIARATIDDFHGKPLLVFRTTPDISWQLVIKRLIDIAGASIGLLILGPFVMLPTVLGIKLTSPGPVLFRQRRSGLHGRMFTMYKFRSMVSNAEMLRAELLAFNQMSGPVFKLKDDPRITRFGRFLRKTSIDELPQLWNVLCGDMSLVGPRPLIDREVERFDPWHRRRLSVKPGLTCLWQISGRSNIDFDQWMKLDLQYIDNWSLGLDLKILLRTIPVVLGGFGAC